MLHAEVILQKLTKKRILVCNEIIFDGLHDMYNRLFLKKIPTEVRSPYLHASFGTFYVQIGQLFEAQWVFEEYMKID